jgi:phosphoserine phosphatase RsbX
MLEKGKNHDGTVLFGAALRAIQPDQPCGDGYLFLPNGHQVLIALVDGLGHGPHAHHATEETINKFSSYAHLPLEENIRKTHHEIKNTRGCVAFLGKIDVPARKMECISIGNITCKLNIKSKVYPLPIAGILGHNLRKTTITSLPLIPGDWIVLSSDGISTRFDPEKLNATRPEDRAEEILHRFGDEHDDASVLVIHLEFGYD